jgi:hypothetical protein
MLVTRAIVEGATAMFEDVLDTECVGQDQGCPNCMRNDVRPQNALESHCTAKNDRGTEEDDYSGKA